MSFEKILKEYENLDNDFGFSAVSEKDYNAAIFEASVATDEYKSKMLELEKMIVPFLQKLHSTGDKEYIYWPNRKPAIEKQIEQILKLTRS